MPSIRNRKQQHQSSKEGHHKGQSGQDIEWMLDTRNLHSNVLPTTVLESQISQQIPLATLTARCTPECHSV